MAAPQKVLPTDAPARRSSFQVIMSDLAQANRTTAVPRQLLTQKSSIKDYRRFTTSEDRVAACLRTYQREVLSVHGTRESTLPFNEQSIEDFMERQKGSGLSETEVHLVLVRIAFLQVVEKSEYDPNRVLWLFFKTTMCYVDLVTDLVTMAYYASVKPTIAAVQGGILVFSFLVQCVISLLLGQPRWVGLMGLIGMKPALEAWRDATGAEAFEGQKMGNDFVRGICRVLEMVTETIPQALTQVVALLVTDKANRTSIQYASLAISLLTAGSAIALTDRTLDNSKARRRTDPKLFGYVPSLKDGHYWQLINMIVFFSTYMGSKMFALSVLVARGEILVAGVWLVVEFAVLLGVRVGIGNWRCYRRGTDGVGIGLLIHLALYVGLLSAPFPILRNPTFLTSRVYSCGLLYMLLVNFAQVAVALYGSQYDEGTVDNRTAWGILAASTAVCVVAGAMAYQSVPRSHKQTFYEHLPFKRYVETFWWNEAKNGVDHKGRELNTQEGVRAMVPLRFSSPYLPMERCKAFYVENWARWEEEEPEWLDEEFKAAIPWEFRPN